MSPLSRSSVLIALAAAVAFSFAAVTPAVASQHDGPQKIVVHLSHATDDLHAASMALSIATALKKAGAEVSLFLDLEGVRLADSRLPDDLRWGRGPTVAERFASFIEAGGSVVLCPHCARNAGLDASSLRKGAKIGTEASVPALFLAADKVLDY